MSALGVLGLLLKDCTIFQPILSCQFFKCINYKQQIFRNLIFISKTSKIYTKDITTGMTLPAPGRQQTRNAQYILISGPKKTELQILPTPVIQLSTWAVMDLNCFCLFIAPMYTVYAYTEKSSKTELRAKEVQVYPCLSICTESIHIHNIP